MPGRSCTATDKKKVKHKEKANTSPHNKKVGCFSLEIQKLFTGPKLTLNTLALMLVRNRNIVISESWLLVWTWKMWKESSSFFFVCLFKSLIFIYLKYTSWLRCIFNRLYPEGDQESLSKLLSKFCVKYFIAGETCSSCVWCFGMSAWFWSEIPSKPETITIFYLDFWLLCWI